MTPHMHAHAIGRVKLAYFHRNSWTKVPVPNGDSHLRSHSCHAIGSQLLVVGGYLPGFRVEPDVECSTELIRVFDMNGIIVRQTPVPTSFRRNSN